MTADTPDEKTDQGRATRLQAQVNAAYALADELEAEGRHLNRLVARGMSGMERPDERHRAAARLRQRLDEAGSVPGTPEHWG